MSYQEGDSPTQPSSLQLRKLEISEQNRGSLETISMECIFDPPESPLLISSTVSDQQGSHLQAVPKNQYLCEQSPRSLLTSQIYTSLSFRTKKRNQLFKKACHDPCPHLCTRTHHSIQL